MSRRMRGVSPKGSSNIKTPQTAPQGSTNARHPIFCFKYMAPKYNIGACRHEDLARFMQHVELMSQTTWGDLLMASRTGFGSEKIERESIQVPIPAAVIEDVKHFISFRASQKHRLVGFRHDDIFRIVWMDPSHNVYKG